MFHILLSPVTTAVTLADPLSHDSVSEQPSWIMATWNFVSNPYCLSAIVCGLLALAVSNYLRQGTKPRRDAKRRFVQDEVRRLSETTFVFVTEAPSPFLLLDTQAQRISLLRSQAPQPIPESTSDQPQTLHTIDGTVYHVHNLASISPLRVLDKGIHFRKGRAVTVSADEAEHTLVFPSRNAADAFLDILSRAKQEKRPQELTLFLSTFNVGNSQPPNDLHPWLSHASTADIVAIGTQECSYTPTTPPFGPSVLHQSSLEGAPQISVSPDDSDDATESEPLIQSQTSQPDALSSQSSGHTSARDHWHALLLAYFPEDQYACVNRLEAWDRSLTIFVRKNLVSAVSRVRSDTANVGLGRVAGNKGAIGTRFSIYDTDFVIINSHLAAHQKEVVRRNEDFSAIVNGLHGLRNHPDVDILGCAVHHVFWIGDLNYRINLEREDVVRLINEENWSKLQAADQLLQERESSRAFHGFQEGRTDFRPTYRYESGSRNYSTTKLRIPSWCDRILFRSLPNCSIDLKEYKPADEIMTSDHSPVYAILTASLMHTSGERNVDDMLPKSKASSAESPQPPSLLFTPRALAVRSLLPKMSPPKTSQLIFTSLRATGIPEMDHGGRRIAVAKALRIDNHMAWKKHEELGAGQHADPYCTFHGSAVAELDEGEYRTNTIVASQSPVWQPDDLPPVDLVDTDMDILRRKYVIITVKDENPAREDATISSAVIWLGEASENGTIKFSTNMSSSGLIRGSIAGEYVIR